MGAKGSHQGAGDPRGHLPGCGGGGLLLWPAWEEDPESRVGTVKTGLIETPRITEPEEDAGRICKIHQAA